MTEALLAECEQHWNFWTRLELPAEHNIKFESKYKRWRLAWNHMSWGLVFSTTGTTRMLRRPLSREATEPWPGDSQAAAGRKLAVAGPLPPRDARAVLGRSGAVRSRPLAGVNASARCSCPAGLFLGWLFFRFSMIYTIRINWGAYGRCFRIGEMSWRVKILGRASGGEGEARSQRIFFRYLMPKKYPTKRFSAGAESTL
jgi:hypothetical protein